MSVVGVIVVMFLVFFSSGLRCANEGSLPSFLLTPPQTPVVFFFFFFFSSTDCFKAVHLFQFFFVCALVVSHVSFVVSLFVPHLSTFGVSGRLCFVIVVIMKTCLYNVDPLKPHFYIVKLEFTGVYIIFLISAQKHRLWVPIRTASSRRF